MTTLAPAKTRIEIFPKPYLFQDHFLKGWSASGAIIDDEEVTFNNEAHYISKTVSYTVSDYPIVVVRITYCTAWGITITGKLSGNAKWTITIEENGYPLVGLHEEDVSSQWSGAIDQIVIQQYGVGQVKVDYLVISQAPTFIPTDSYEVSNMEIDLELAQEAASGAVIDLANPEGEYSGVIPLHSAVIIWLARDVANLGIKEYKTFGGRVIKVSSKSAGYGTGALRLECHSHGFELSFPPALYTRNYTATYGRTIIEDYINDLAYLAKSSVAAKWFDSGGASGSTDDRIAPASAYTEDQDEELPLGIIAQILEKAINPIGVRGFDISELPSGVLIGHLRESTDFQITDILSPEDYSYDEDLYRVRNSLLVYGAQLKNSSDDLSFPESTSNWSTDGPAHNIASGNWGGFVKAGLYALKAYPSGGSQIGEAYAMKYMFSPDMDLTTKMSYTALFFAYSIQAETAGGSTVTVQPYIDYAEVHLIDKDNNRVGYDIKNKMGVIALEDFNEYDIRTYNEVEVPVGPHEEKKGQWELVWGSPDFDLSAVRGFSFRTGITWESTIDLFSSFMIDWVHWGKGYFRGREGDAISQDDYGIRIEKIEDDTLMSDADCSQRALGELAFLKDAIVTLQNFSVDGDLKYLPGYKIRANIPQENLLNEWMRIVGVKHRVIGPVWDSQLTLSNEPQYLDYVYRSHLGRGWRRK